MRARRRKLRIQTRLVLIESPRQLSTLPGYPVVALSFQRVRIVHVGIIHVNQQDRNSGGAIWSRIDIRDGDFSKESIAG